MIDAGTCCCCRRGETNDIDKFNDCCLEKDTWQSCVRKGTSRIKADERRTGVRAASQLWFSREKLGSILILVENKLTNAHTVKAQH